MFIFLSPLWLFIHSNWVFEQQKQIKNKTNLKVNALENACFVDRERYIFYK